jgi:hypothetical protein
MRGTGRSAMHCQNVDCMATTMHTNVAVACLDTGIVSLPVGVDGRLLFSRTIHCRLVASAVAHALQLCSAHAIYLATG